MYVNFTGESHLQKVTFSHPFPDPIVVLDHYVLCVWTLACTPHSFGSRIDIA